MWDNHQALDFLASSLFAVTGLMVLYAINEWTVNSPVFPLKEVSVSAINDSRGELKHVTRDQINGAVQSKVRGNFFTVDIDATRAAFRKLPWVRDASVRRVWPQSLDVMLEEHIVLARWGSTGLVNTYGEVFDAASDEKLPLLQGPAESSRDMVRQYAVFNKLLRPLQQKVEQIHLSPRRAWRVHLDTGIILELGREKMGARLKRYVVAHDSSIAKLSQQLSYVDLRYPNGFAVR
jgi:cell division protein FtsQ